MPVYDVTIELPMTGETETRTIDAAYYQTENGDGFVTFKDANNKQVASFQRDRVLSVSRSQQQTSVGSVTVNVMPEIDKDAMKRFVEEMKREAMKAGWSGFETPELRDKGVIRGR